MLNMFKKMENELTICIESDLVMIFFFFFLLMKIQRYNPHCLEF